MPLEFPAGPFGRPQFPEPYRLPVISAEASARLALQASLAPIPIAVIYSKHIDSSKVKPHVVRYVSTVVGTFAEQACLAVKDGRWNLVVLDATIEVFVDQALHQAYWGIANEKIRTAWKDSSAFSLEIRPAVMAEQWHIDYLQRVPELAIRPAPVPTEVAIPDDQNVRAERRRAAIEPLLKANGFSQAKWANIAGVDTSVVYDYMSGSSQPRPESRNALAGALDLKEPDLPP
jgi:hypothetical protein